MASTKKTTKAEENSALDYNMDDFKFELELPVTFEGTVYKEITLKGLWDLAVSYTHLTLPTSDLV